MAERLTAEEFDALGLADWRYLLGSIETAFRCGSFSKAAAFIEAVAYLADDVGHHPDVDLRHPDRVRITLITQSQRSLTVLDTDMAQRISEIAKDFGATAEPLRPTRIEFAIDVMDVDAVRPFWKAVLGYVDDGAIDGTMWTISDPLGLETPMWFQQMDTPRTERNRIHFDVTVAHEVAEERVQAALDAGGTLVSAERARSFWVLADAEGNEACVCTWQDRN